MTWLLNDGPLLADSRAEMQMALDKMHADEVATDVELVNCLLATQFPRWFGLPIEPIRSAGTDHAIYRLGDDMAVRMPRIGWAIDQVEKEHRWLPMLASRLPLAIPVPLAKGRPGEGYPWNWSVCRWLDGENATLDRLADPRQAAKDLAGFVRALWEINAANGPPAGPHNFGRGLPLATRDAPTRAAIAALHGTLDTDALTIAWDAALAVPAWDRPPVWIHGDLQSGNLLAVQGRLDAVIDFGGLGVGDPACDLMVAWNLFSGESRETYRATTAVDEATWNRGRGWALSVALIALPYYRDSNPDIAHVARYTIDEVLREFA